MFPKAKAPNKFLEGVTFSVVENHFPFSFPVDFYEYGNVAEMFPKCFCGFSCAYPPRFLSVCEQDHTPGVSPDIKTRIDASSVICTKAVR